MPGDSSALESKVCIVQQTLFHSLLSLWRFQSLPSCWLLSTGGTWNLWPLLFSLQLEPKAASPHQAWPSYSLPQQGVCSPRRGITHQWVLKTAMPYGKEGPGNTPQGSLESQDWQETHHPRRKGKCRAFPPSVNMCVEESSFKYKRNACKISILPSSVSVTVFEDGPVTCSFLLAGHRAVICQQFSTCKGWESKSDSNPSKAMTSWKRTEVGGG